MRENTKRKHFEIEDDEKKNSSKKWFKKGKAWFKNRSDVVNNRTREKRRWAK